MAASRPQAITSMEDYTESRNIAIFSHSGAGKTVFAGTMPNGLILSTEKGLISAKLQGSTCDVWRIEAWQDHPEELDLISAYEWLRDNPDHGYDWIALDSVTRMQYLALRGILGIAVEANPNRDLDIPAIQDHQKWQNMMKRFIADFCELPVNVLFTALAMDVEDEEGDPLVMPFLLGKGYSISQWFCGEMQQVGYLHVIPGKDGEKPKRRLQLAHKPPHFTKDRYDLGSYIDNPSMPTLDKLIDKAEATAHERRAGIGKPRSAGKSVPKKAPPIDRTADRPATKRVPARRPQKG